MLIEPADVVIDADADADAAVVDTAEVLMPDENRGTSGDDDDDDTTGTDVGLEMTEQEIIFLSINNFRNKI